MKLLTIQPSVKVSVRRLALRRLFVFGTVPARESDYVIVEVETADGVVGVNGSLQMNPWSFAGHEEFKAQCYVIMPQLIQLCCKTINSVLKKDSDPKTPVQYWDVLYKACKQAAQEKWGQQFPDLAVSVALAAFEFAIWDAYGKTNNLPWAKCLSTEFLGDDALDSAVLNRPNPRTTVLHTIGGADAPWQKDLQTAAYAGSILVKDNLPTNLLDEMHLGGFTNIKPKSSGDVEKDAARMAAIDEVLWQYREDVSFEGLFETYYDANCTVGTVDNLHRLIDRIGHVDGLRRTVNFEQPFSIQDTFRKGFEIRGFDGICTISIDESCVTLDDVRRAYEMGYRRIGIKVCKSITETLRMVKLAKELGMAYDIQDLTQVGYGIVTSASVAAWLGCPMESNGWKNIADAEALLPAGNYNGIWIPKHGGFVTGNLTGAGISAV